MDIDLLQKKMIDLVNNLQMAGEKLFKHFYGPFFQSFGHQSVVCVGKSTCTDIPCFVPFKTFFVDKQPHQFGNGNRRVGIVQLNGAKIGETAPVGMNFFITSQNIFQRTGHKEILLF